MKGTARKSTAASSICFSDGMMYPLPSDTMQGGVCRTCLTPQPTTRLLSLFLYWAPPWKLRRGPDDQIAKQLCKLTGIEIEESDGYPQEICYPCFDSFKDAYRFFYRVRHHDNKMRSSQLLVENPSLSLSELTSLWSKSQQTPETVRVKEEVLSSEETAEEEGSGQDGGQGEMKDIAEIKIEPEELVMVNGQKSPKSNIIISSSFSMETTQPGHAKAFECADMVKEELETDLDSDLPLECLLCQREFNTISGLKAHVITTHSYKTVTRRKSHTARSAKSCKERHRNRHKREMDSCHECGNTLTTEESERKIAHCDSCASQVIKSESPLPHEMITDAKYGKTKTVRQLRREHAEEMENPEKRRKSSEESYECAICNETFNEKFYLKIHNEACHSISDTDTAPKSDDIMNPVDKIENVNEDLSNHKISVNENENIIEDINKNPINNEVVDKHEDNLFDMLGNCKQSEQNKSISLKHISEQNKSISPGKHSLEHHVHEYEEIKIELVENNVTLNLDNKNCNDILKNVNKDVGHVLISNDNEKDVNFKSVEIVNEAHLSVVVKKEDENGVSENEEHELDSVCEE